MAKVVIYSSDSCGYCRMAKDFLRQNGVDFLEKNISYDGQARQEMQDLGAAGVPVILVDGEVIIGFDKDRLQALLGKKILECPTCRQKMRVPRNRGILRVTCPKCAADFKVDSSQ